MNLFFIEIILDGKLTFGLAHVILNLQMVVVIMKGEAPVDLMETFHRLKFHPGYFMNQNLISYGTGTSSAQIIF